MLGLMLPLLSAAADPARVIVTPKLSWSLLAWGWKDGGKDSTDGKKVVDVDLDGGTDKIRGLVENGHIVVCYFSSGTLEGFRPDCDAGSDGKCRKNAKKWEPLIVGKMQGWDEAWLDITNLEGLKEVMAPRFQRAAQYGCHAVEPDNIDCYDNDDCGKPESAQIAYNKWQAEYAHSLGLAIGQKNAAGLSHHLESSYDFVVNESCDVYEECDKYRNYLDANKAVFSVEYRTDTKHCADLCKCAAAEGIQKKFCEGNEKSSGDCSDDQGCICIHGSWRDCFPSESPLPPTECTSGKYSGSKCEDAAITV
mmetsp:Transcript_35759/g.86070  ORF Transcript_35759/g.86070 Transcript_35759/m.86070 type:complete len:308 (+) Transcript_35759:48-971(+)